MQLLPSEERQGAAQSGNGDGSRLYPAPAWKPPSGVARPSTAVDDSAIATFGKRGGPNLGAELSLPASVSYG